MNILESYLNFIQEKDWDGGDTWEDHIQLNKIRDLLKHHPDIDEKDLDSARHTIQPMLVKLIGTAGGDYRGRITTRNSDTGDFAGTDWLEKNLPKDWRKKAKKYIEKVARKHHE